MQSVTKLVPILELSCIQFLNVTLHNQRTKKIKTQACTLKLMKNEFCRIGQFRHEKLKLEQLNRIFLYFWFFVKSLDNHIGCLIVN